MTRAIVSGCRAGGLVLLLAIAPTASGAAYAQEPEPAQAEALVLEDAAMGGASTCADVRVSRAPEGGLEVEGRCVADASRVAAWNVLTDYDGIDGFVSSMRDSRVTGHGDDYVLVDQVAVGRLFLFTRRLHATLRVHEEPPGRIRFEDVLHRDFVSYRGEWRIEERGSGVEIIYRVTALPAFSVPDFIARGMFRHTVGELLAQVRAEIERREALARR